MNAAHGTHDVNTIAKVRDESMYADHLNTPREIDDSVDRAIWIWGTQNFGGNAPNEDPDGDSIQFVLGLRFSGQYYDSESGLSYNYSRDYEADTGRYIESDLIGLDGGANTYTYAAQNPLSRFDMSYLLN